MPERLLNTGAQTTSYNGVENCPRSQVARRLCLRQEKQRKALQVVVFLGATATPAKSTSPAAAAEAMLVLSRCVAISNTMLPITLSPGINRV